MRFYSIEITNPQTGEKIIPASLGGNGITSIMPNGQTNPAALNIELDIPFVNFAAPDNNAWLRIWGIGLQQIGNAFDLNGMDITVSVGMSKGLPLANPAQQGLVLSGSILQAYGNWIGLDQTLDFNFAPKTGIPSDPLNFSFTWQAGTPLATAIAQTLSTALPGMKQDIQISPNLIISSTETGYYQSAQQFAAFINQRSKPIIGGSYMGVQISTDGRTVTVWDGTAKADPKKVKAIAFQDMIGQPTWIGTNEITVKLVMRGDLNISDAINLPPSLATTTQQALLRFQDRTTFSGNFIITQIHHYGNFRQPDAASWNTTIYATPQTQ